ncbi:MAG: calcium-binding protein [Thermodesulfobacteriota bacterium]
MQTKSIERRRERAAMRTYACRAGLAAAAATAVLAAADAHAEVRARFSQASGLLTVVGGRDDDRILVSRSFGGLIHVNEGATPVLGGVPNVGNTRRVVIRGSSGDDRIELDERNGALPQAVLAGGPGNDLLRGGSGDDDLRGGPGDDTLIGSRGHDRIRGDGGDDTIDWFGGEGADRIDGGAGRDRVQIRAPKLQENDIDLLPDGRKVVVLFDGASPLRLENLRVERFILHGGDLRDIVTASPSLGKGVTLSVYGGEGDDIITGTDGADTLVGNGGHDTIIGLGGNDYLVGESGDDTLAGGDGDDALHGGSGRDSLDGGPGIDVAEEGEIVINVP